MPNATAQAPAQPAEHLAQSQHIPIVPGTATIILDLGASFPWRLCVTSTEYEPLRYGYSSVPSHKSYGEYVFAFRLAAELTNGPKPSDLQPVVRLQLEQPFAYLGLRLGGVYQFERGTRSLWLRNTETGRTVRVD